MAIVPTLEPGPRARAVEAVLHPLLDLFEAATGGPAAFFAEMRVPGAHLRYAFAREGGLVETVQAPAGAAHGAPRPAAGGLRVAAFLHDARGHVRGHLEAASLGGRPFEVASQRAIEACAKVLDAHLAAHAFDGPAAPGGDALSDPLTGLPNRAALLGELERMLARAQRDDMTVFTVCVGLSGLEDAGSEAFDRRLAALATRLAEGVRGGDVVARTGLHEFVVAGSIPRATAEASAAVVLERLQARCAASAAGRARIDMGFAIARIGAFDASTLLAEAEAALLA